MKTQKAFSLVELMITVGIIGILASIAYPSYQNSLQQSRRAEAKAVLLELTNFMERLYTEANCYNPGPDRLCGNGDDDAPVLPFITSPKSGTAYYDLMFLAIDETSYTLQAVPIVGSPQANDVCGTMSINSFGQKTPDPNNPDPAATKCW